MNATDDRERAHGGRLAAGVILITLGVFFLLFDRGVVEMDFPWQWWPLVLVAIGAGRLVTATHHDERRAGLWMILLGGWLLVNFLRLFGLGWHNSWPLLIIIAGGMTVWKAIANPERPVRSEAGEAGGEGR
jgi:cytochrome bd-type quinol oxidase subunit 2